MKWWTEYIKCLPSRAFIQASKTDKKGKYLPILYAEIIAITKK